MNTEQLAKDYQQRGWFANMTPEQIHDEILTLERETLRVDKRTHNGKMTQAFNNSKIAIANIILEAHK